MAELSDELVRRLTPVREVIHRARSTVFPVVGRGLSLGPPGKAAHVLIPGGYRDVKH